MGGFDGYYQMNDKLIAGELQWNIRFEAWWIGVFSEDCKNCLKHTQMLYYKNWINEKVWTGRIYSHVNHINNFLFKQLVKHVFLKAGRTWNLIERTYLLAVAVLIT